MDNVNEIELGNLIFGNSRGPIRFSRDFENVDKWHELIYDTIGVEDYHCTLGKYCVDGDGVSYIERTNLLTPTDFGGYSCLDKHGDIVFEIFPYYWGDCTCGADEKNELLFEETKKKIFTKEELILLSTTPPDCDDLCPASDMIDDANFDKPIEELVKICTCGAKQKEKELLDKIKKFDFKNEEFSKEIDKNQVNHSEDCLLCKHNFVFHPKKEDEFWVDWYKYPFRDAFCNKEITKEEFSSILDTCIKATKEDIKRKER